MIVFMKESHTDEQLRNVVSKIESLGAKAHVVQGRAQTTVSLVGPAQKIDEDQLSSLTGVDRVVRVGKPFKLAAKTHSAHQSVIELPGLKIGGGHFVAMAGPCSVESEEQTLRIAHEVKKHGATILRGGAYKPRTSPYAFQGLGKKGLEILSLAKKETGLYIISELMDIQDLDDVLKYVDIIQIGARNMQNYPLLRELGKLHKPVMLKRGMSATIDEWLLAAEYICNQGNDQVLLCERGIRSFDNTYSRNTLDLNAVAIVRNLSHLPIVVDPSHGTGFRHLVAPMAVAGTAAGADAVIVEVHDQPEQALSDGPQALLPQDFHELMNRLKHLGQALDLNVQTTIERKSKKQVA